MGKAGTGAAGGVVASQQGNRGSDFILYNDGGGKAWRFALSYADDDGWSYQYTDLINPNSASRVGVWTQVTASYNALSGLMALYVDGILAGTGYHTAAQSSAPTHAFELGRYRYQGAASSSSDGSVSATTVYPFAVSPTANGTTGTIASGVNQGMCVDDNGFGALSRPARLERDQRQPAPAVGLPLRRFPAVDHPDSADRPHPGTGQVTRSAH